MSSYVEPTRIGQTRTGIAIGTGLPFVSEVAKCRHCKQLAWFNQEWLRAQKRGPVCGECFEGACDSIASRREDHQGEE